MRIYTDLILLKLDFYFIELKFKFAKINYEVVVKLLNINNLKAK